MSRKTIVVVVLALGITFTAISTLADKKVETNVPVSEKYITCKKQGRLIKVPRILINEPQEKLFESSEMVVWSSENRELYTLKGGVQNLG